MDSLTHHSGQFCPSLWATLFIAVGNVDYKRWANLPTAVGKTDRCGLTILVDHF